MKKIILLIVLMMTSISSVKAANITENKISNVFANQTYQGRELSASFGYMYANDVIAYCVDPGIPLKIGYYDKTLDFGYKNIDKTKKERMQLIAYYGYQFPGHNSEKYYFATQALIWETIGSTNVSFTTERNRGGQVIDITKEKKEILDNVNKVLTLPSFVNTKIEGYLGETITLEDSNNSYFNFGYTSTNKNSYNFNNGKFNIELKELGKGKIKISKKLSSIKESALFYTAGYQTVVTLGIDVVKEGYIDILVKDPNRIKLKVNNYSKTDNKPIGDSSFQIKNLDTDSYLEFNGQKEFITDENGLIIFPDYINSGNYQLEQIAVNDDYIINPQNIIFYVNEKTPTIDIDGEKYLNINFYNSQVVVDRVESDNNLPITTLPKTSNKYIIYEGLLFVLLCLGFKFYYYAKKNY